MNNNLKVVIIGNGQLAKSIKSLIYTDAKVVSYPEIDISSQESVELVFSKIDKMDILINAAAWTNVNEAELTENHKKVYGVNGVGVGFLADIANQYDAIFVHISTDYVFDGSTPKHYEEESLSPLNIYGKSKVLGEEEAKKARKFYILRASWLIGNNFPSDSSSNFVKTMFKMAVKGSEIKVVNDQFGRLTFTSELSKAIKHLVDNSAAFGIYNISNSGPVVAWSDIAEDVYEMVTRSRISKKIGTIHGVSTDQYEREFPPIVSIKRPKQSDFDLNKIESTGFIPLDHLELLSQYVERLIEEYKGELN